MMKRDVLALQSQSLQRPKLQAMQPCPGPGQGLAKPLLEKGCHLTQAAVINGKVKLTFSFDSNFFTERCNRKEYIQVGL